MPGNAIYWDIDVAIEKGFFKDEGFAPEVVIFQSSPQSIQLLVAGEVQLAGAQPEALLAAVAHGSKGFAVISSPAERPDWFALGTQFHPEKSQRVGLAMLHKFGELS